MRRCVSQLMDLAKRHGVAMLLAGHVTKEGDLAGPRLLEHLVDVVLYFEGSGRPPQSLWPCPCPANPGCVAVASTAGRGA